MTFTTEDRTVPKTDEHFMSLALREATKARDLGEVPIGAVVVQGDKVIARAHNRKETQSDPTAHAELLVIKKTARKLKNWRLTGCTLYVTLEPCPMCLSAIIQARVDRVVFGTTDPVMGACGSKLDLTEVHSANPIIEIKAEVLADECREIIGQFWKERRKRSTPK